MFRNATSGVPLDSGVFLGGISGVPTVSGVEVPPPAAPLRESGVFVLEAGSLEKCLGGGVLTGLLSESLERTVGLVIPPHSPSWVGVCRMGIPLGLCLVCTEDAARVTLRSSSILGSFSFVLSEVARRDTPENIRLWLGWINIKVYSNVPVFK